jgi:hypothetical protein
MQLLLVLLCSKDLLDQSHVVGGVLLDMMGSLTLGLLLLLLLVVEVLLLIDDCVFVYQILCFLL